MKKILSLLFIALLIFPVVSAINVTVEKQSENEVLVIDMATPVIFDLKVTNYGPSDQFKFYNLLGFTMLPSELIQINQNQTKDIQLEIKPIGEFEQRGLYALEYFIQARDDTKLGEKLVFRIVEIADSFEIGSGELNIEANAIQIYISNKVNFNFENINADFSSPFFEFERDFSLEPYERKTFTVEFNKEEFKELMAGFYTLTADLTVNDQEAEIEGVIKFVEKDILTTTKKNYGFIIYTNIIEKKNEGNVIVKSETIVKKNIISRLFTSFSSEPDMIDRDGTVVYYAWIKDINPGETLEIVVKTNWLFPLLIIAIIIVIVVSVKQYTKTNLVLRKKVAFVKAKGGEFALKVSIFVQARKYVERVSIIERLPSLVKIYEKFGREEPARVDEQNRRIEWNYEKLEEGETRLLTYIVYSKIGVVGKFALPSATAVYEKDGKIQEAQSNKAFFVAEQRKKDEEE